MMGGAIFLFCVSIYREDGPAQEEAGKASISCRSLVNDFRVIKRPMWVALESPQNQ